MREAINLKFSYQRQAHISKIKLTINQFEMTFCMIHRHRTIPDVKFEFGTS